MQYKNDYASFIIIVIPFILGWIKINVNATSVVITEPKLPQARAL
jgi:hypothetical protein